MAPALPLGGSHPLAKLQIRELHPSAAELWLNDDEVARWGVVMAAASYDSSARPCGPRRTTRSPPPRRSSSGPDSVPLWSPRLRFRPLLNLNLIPPQAPCWHLCSACSHVHFPTSASLSVSLLLLLASPLAVFLQQLGSRSARAAPGSTSALRFPLIPVRPAGRPELGAQSVSLGKGVSQPTPITRRDNPLRRPRGGPAEQVRGGGRKEGFLERRRLRQRYAGRLGGFPRTAAATGSCPRCPPHPSTPS